MENRPRKNYYKQDYKTKNPIYKTPNEIARILKITPYHVLRLIRNGHLKAKNISKSPVAQPRYRVRLEDLEAFVEERTARWVAEAQSRRETYLKDFKNSLKEQERIEAYLKD